MFIVTTLSTRKKSEPHKLQWSSPLSHPLWVKRQTQTPREGVREGGSADLGRGEGKERPTVQRERREADGGDWGMRRRRGSEGPGARREAAGERRRSAVSRQRPMAEPETVRLGSETGQPPVLWCPRLQRKGSMGEAVSTAVPVLGRALSPPTPGLLADLQTPLDRNKE